MAASVASNSFGLGATLLVQLVSVPLLIHGLGVREYGIWLVLSAIPAYLTLTDLGMSAAASTEATLCVARKQYDQARLAILSVWAFVSYLAIFASVLVGGAAVFILLRHPLNGVPPGVQVVVVLGQLGYFLLYLQAGFIEASLRANGEISKGVLGYSCLRLSDLVAIVLAGVIGQSLIVLALSVLCVRLAATIVYAAYGLRRVTWLRGQQLSTDWTVARRLFAPSVGYMAFSVGNAIVGQGCLIVVGATLGVGRVVEFSTVRTVSSVIRQCISIFDRALVPELSVALARGDLSRARIVFRMLWVASVASCVAAVAVLTVTGRWVILTWTGGSVSVDPIFLILMLGTVLADVPWLAALSALTSVNRHQRVGLIFVALSAACVGLCVIAVPRYGLLSVPILLFLPDLILTPICVAAARRVLNEEPNRP